MMSALRPPLSFKLISWLSFPAPAADGIVIDVGIGRWRLTGTDEISLGRLVSPAIPSASVMENVTPANEIRPIVEPPRPTPAVVAVRLDLPGFDALAGDRVDPVEEQG